MYIYEVGSEPIMAVLEVRDLRKKYTSLGGKSREALKGLSFQVEEGSVTGLLGPNGAGKTTTLKILVGLVRPDAGSVKVLGRDWCVDVLREIGFLPEQPYFEYYMTPRRLLRFYGRLLGLEEDHLPGKVGHVLNLVGLEREADLPLEKFSKGMLQRVGLAQALLGDPRLLILDEPSSGLDPLGRIQVKELIAEMREKGVAVLLSSHQLSEIEEICDRVVMLYGGREVAAGTLDELLYRGDEVEIRLKDGIPAGLAEKLRNHVLSEDKGKRTFVVKRAVQSDVLRLLTESGVEVEELRPRRISLEEFFLSRLREARED
ncbi:MAG: ABC transporter ATP-binding protein [Candidatus Geothermincolales bacterium]